MNNNKGFTLVELLVVVLIIGILAAMAMPAYFKAVERARASEAETMIGTVVNAQQRYKMKTGKFAKKWTSLDIAPANATTSAAYCTKGAQGTAVEAGAVGYPTGTVCGGQNGFYIVLIGDNASSDADNTNGVIAYRVGTGQYTYSIQKHYQSNDPPVCIAGTSTDDNELFCAKFNGVEAYADSATAREANTVAAYTGGTN
ncbi:MAG: prepilin-type N-terminal cleavage/methylation domain-containing protein [Elusimicrobiaceae bacterium]|nr:prepilin-type N-terminal cleavage/methylation domain-containing protein [Elusimicrobiaceae bacterium]